MNSRFLSGITLLLMMTMAWANIIDDPTLLYQMPVSNNSVLEQKVTVNWRVKSLNEVINSLLKVYGINSRVLTVSNSPQSAGLVMIDNQSLSRLLDFVADKFGYNWSYKNKLVVFSAIAPIVKNNFGINGLGNLGVINSQQLWLLDPKDRTLRNALMKWCAYAKWQLVWNIRADYPITNLWRISGTFEYAVNEVLKSLQNAEVPLSATMYDSNKVLEISSQVVR